MMQIAVMFESDIAPRLHEPQRVLGRAIANDGLLRALRRVPDLEITLLIATTLERELVMQQCGDDARVRTLTEFSQRAATERVEILHAFNPDLYRMLHLRTATAHARGMRCAVSGMTHSLSHDPFCAWLWQTLIAHPAPWDRLVCTTPTARDVIMQMVTQCKSRLHDDVALATHVIPLGLDLADANATPLSRAALQVPNDAVLLTYLGRLSPYRKVDLLPLLLMLRTLREQCVTPFCCVIAGATSNERYDELLQAAAQEYGVADLIRIVPNLDAAQKWSLLRASDLCLAPSDNLQETFGLSVIEALACGVPVIAANWDGYRALFTDRAHGALIPTIAGVLPHHARAIAPLQIDSQRHMWQSQLVAIDHVAWVARTAELINDHELRRTQAAAAKAHAAQFSWDRIAAQYVTLWESQSRAARDCSDDVYAQAIAGTAALDFDRIFAGYPSQHLSDATSLTLTAIARDMASGALPVRTYDGCEEWLDLGVVSAIMRTCASPHTLATLTQSLHEKFSTDVLHAHVHWMLKYGMLE